MIKDLDCTELDSQLFCDLECVLDDVQPFDQMDYPNVSLSVAFGLSEELVAEPTRLDLVHEPLGEILRGQVLLELHDCHLGVLCGQLVLLHDRLDVRGCRLADLELQLVPRTKLVLDVLHRTEALEDASFDHDSHLGAECLSFFHRVGCQDDGALLSLLAEACDNLPHEATGFRIHA